MKLEPLDEIVKIEDLQDNFAYNDSLKCLFYRSGESWIPVLEDSFVEINGYLIRTGRVQQALRKHQIIL